MPQNVKQDKIKEITDQLEQGIQELFESERYMEYLRTMSKFHNYSLNNTLLIAQQRPDATLVAGYTTWQKEFGRQVQKGEKAIKILAPAPYKRQVEMDKIDPNTNRPVLDAQGNPIKERKEVTHLSFRITNVFDVSQTEGREIPSIGVDELTGTVAEYDNFFEALKRTCPVPMDFEEIASGAKGYYHQLEHRIAIQSDMSQVQTIKTAIHEMAHQKLHAMENQKEGDPKLSRNAKEVEAESVAYTICQHYGIDTSDYSFSYIAGWSAGKETPELKASLGTIRQAAHEMITEIDSHVQEIVVEKEAVRENRAEQLAVDLDRFAELADPYEYRDRVGGEAEMEQHITEIKEQLLSRDPAIKDITKELLEMAGEDSALAYQAEELSLRLMDFYPEGTEAELEQQTLDLGLVEADEAALRIGSLPEEEHYLELHRTEAGIYSFQIYDGALQLEKIGRIEADTLTDAKDIVVEDQGWAGLKQNLLITSDFSEMKELAQAAAMMPDPSPLDCDQAKFSAAARSNYEGMTVLMTDDGNVYLGKTANYDNHGNYDNEDRSLTYLTDDKSLFSLLGSEGCVKTRSECIAGGIYSAESLAAYDQLRAGVLSQFQEVREPYFGEPVEEAAFKVGAEHYLSMQVASDGSWDYTLYGNDYLEVDGGQIGDADMSFDTAKEEILAAHDLKDKILEPMATEELESQTRFAEAKDLHEHGLVYQDYVLRSELGVEMDEAMEGRLLDRSDFTEEQMAVITAAAEKGLPYDDLLKPDLTVEQMQFASEMMEQGYDVTAVYVKGTQISLVDKPLDAEAIADIKCQMEYDSIPKMLYSNEQWKEIQDGMRQKLDVMVYAKKEYEPAQMMELRRGLSKGIDVSAYADPAFSSQQMRFIRRSLESGFDVSSFAKPEVPASEMKEAYFALRDGTKAPESQAQNVQTRKGSQEVSSPADAEHKLYRYYATQLPVMPGSIPSGENRPINVMNYDKREPVCGGTMQAWGYVEYAKPLTEQQMKSYELKMEPKQPSVQKQTAVPVKAEPAVGRKEAGKKPSVLANLRSKQALLADAAKQDTAKKMTKER